MYSEEIGWGLICRGTSYHCSASLKTRVGVGARFPVWATDFVASEGLVERGKVRREGEGAGDCVRRWLIRGMD